MDESPARYFHIPFLERGRSVEGVDCWGLIVLIYREQFGITLPPYADSYETTSRVSADAMAATVEHEKAEHWRAVAEADACFPDAILLRLWNRPMHVGVVIERGRFLHAIEGVGVCVERYKDRQWINRVLGFYRHRAMDNARYDHRHISHQHDRPG
jgi:cell wall-associated NlpC family hydrolase